MAHTDCEIAVLGAGPYGLSAAAHLGAIDGLDVRIFGPPMSFWERNMPVGMLLRSPWVASNLSHPGRRFTLDEYRDDTEQAFGSPVPLDRFVDYGRWFQRQTVPGLDDRTVRRVEANGDGFVLELEDGEPMRARRVVVAAGIAPFAHRPAAVRHAPPGARVARRRAPRPAPLRRPAGRRRRRRPERARVGRAAA